MRKNTKIIVVILIVLGMICSGLLNRIIDRKVERDLEKIKNLSPVHTIYEDLGDGI